MFTTAPELVLVSLYMSHTMSQQLAVMRPIEHRAL